MNRKNAHKIANELGATIELPNKTGEFRYWHPKMDRPVTGDNRKKGVSRAVSKWLMDLEKKLSLPE